VLRVRTAEALDGFRLRLGLTDGTERIVDVAPYLNGPIFELLRNDPSVFAAVRVDEVFGTVVWPNGADIDPDVLLNGRTAASLAATRS
jgi:hypothetical protein